MEIIIALNFAITSSNRAKIGYTGAVGENLVIPAVFQDGDAWYRVTSIDSFAFYNCSGLTSVVIGDSVKYIGWGTFGGCSGLTSVTIPDSVTVIFHEAFYGCSGLTSVTIPDRVTVIHDGAFYDCSGLTSIQYSGTIAEWNAISKGSNWNSNVPATKVICSDGEVDI